MCVGMPRPAGLPRSAEGVVVRHSVGCPGGSGGPCQCRPGFQAQVWSPRDRRTIRRTFRSSAEARGWRAQTHTALRAGTMLAPTRITVGQAAELWLKGAASGVIRTRAGDEYKPSALRSYEQSLRTHALPRLGSLRLSAVTRTVVQDLVDELVASGFSPSTVRNAILPLRAIYRRAVGRAELVVNPTLGLAMPAVRSRRERVGRPGEAAALVESTPIRDRAIWATALYAGLRLGELKALRWEDVDFEAGLIRVERGWDKKAGAGTLQNARWHVVTVSSKAKTVNVGKRIP